MRSSKFAWLSLLLMAFAQFSSAQSENLVYPYSRGLPELQPHWRMGVTWFDTLIDPCVLTSPPHPLLSPEGRREAARLLALTTKPDAYFEVLEDPSKAAKLDCRTAFTVGLIALAVDVRPWAQTPEGAEKNLVTAATALKRAAESDEPELKSFADLAEAVVYARRFGIREKARLWAAEERWRKEHPERALMAAWHLSKLYKEASDYDNYRGTCERIVDRYAQCRSFRAYKQSFYFKARGFSTLAQRAPTKSTRGLSKAGAKALKHVRGLGEGMETLMGGNMQDCLYVHRLLKKHQFDVMAMGSLLYGVYVDEGMRPQAVAVILQDPRGRRIWADYQRDQLLIYGDPKLGDQLKGYLKWTKAKDRTPHFTLSLIH